MTRKNHPPLIENFIKNGYPAVRQRSIIRS